MELLVDWVYGDFQEHLGLQQYVALFQAAHKFNIEHLRKECIRVLASLVNCDTLPQLEHLAAAYDDCHQLKQVCSCTHILLNCE